MAVGTSDHPEDCDLDVELWPGDTVHVHSAARASQAREFRDVLGRFATGVTVVTGQVGAEPVGVTCQGFMSVSLEPPLVLFSIARASRSWPRLRESGAFCVNLLAADQVAISEQMAAHDGDRFTGLSWTPTPGTGSPLLAGVIGHVDCRIHAVHEAGDHWLVLGRVVGLGAAEGGAALTYYRGRYGEIG